MQRKIDRWSQLECLHMHTELGMARKNDNAGVTGKGSEKQVSGHSSPERIMAHLLR